MRLDKIHVVVGVVISHDQKVLLTKRPLNVHQGGLWEFPGGKLEPGEFPRAALDRELKEEVGIVVDKGRPLVRFPHDYAECSVLLDVWLVFAWHGNISGREGQEYEWVPVSDLKTVDFPAANKVIINAVRLSSLYLICPFPMESPSDYLGKIENCLGAGARFLQLRFGDEDLQKHPMLVSRIREICDRYNAKVLLNSIPEQATSLCAHGVHLSSARLLQTGQRPLDSEHWVAASCHDSNELTHASRIGVDFVVLSPVQHTGSHPNAIPLGWKKFSQLVEDIKVPVYALGGMRPRDINIAWEHGAQGVAVLSSIWSVDDPGEIIRQYLAGGL